MASVAGIQSVAAAPTHTARIAAEPAETATPSAGPLPVTGVKPGGDQTAPQAQNGGTQTSEAATPAGRQELEAALRDLREAMANLPGGEREVNILYRSEDRSYLIEIRNKETGALLQTFPPENLLNLSRRSADLLGVLIDRQS